MTRVKLTAETDHRSAWAGFDDVGHRLGLTTGAQMIASHSPATYGALQMCFDLMCL